MEIIRIDDADDPRIAPYRAVRERDLVGRDGQFIVEGKFILETLLTRSRFPAVSAMILDSRIAPLGDILARAPEGFPVFTVSRNIMDQVAGFPVHRGILALGSAIATATKPAQGPVALLAGIANPDNVGAIFRNAAGLGIGAVLLDSQCCDPLYRKAIRVSMGASLVLPWQRVADAGEAVRAHAVAGGKAFALTPSATMAIEDTHFGSMPMVVFGEEAHGLAEDVMALCERVSIPMASGTDSLNVAASSAIVFDAMRRYRKGR